MSIHKKNKKQTIKKINKCFSVLTYDPIVNCEYRLQKEFLMYFLLYLVLSNLLKWQYGQILSRNAQLCIYYLNTCERKPSPCPIFFSFLTKGRARKVFHLGRATWVQFDQSKVRQSTASWWNCLGKTLKKLLNFDIKFRK